AWRTSAPSTDGSVATRSPPPGRLPDEGRTTVAPKDDSGPLPLVDRAGPADTRPVTKLDYGDFLREVEGSDGQRRRRRRNERKKRVGAALRTLAVVLLVVGVAAAARSQLSSLHPVRPKLVAEQSTTTTTVLAAAGNTTTTFGLSRRSYQPGD